MLGENITEKQAQTIIQEVRYESNASEELTFDEFCEFINYEMHAAELPVDELVASMFSVLDINSDGSVTRDEFASTIQLLGISCDDSDIRAIIEEIDTGTVSLLQEKANLLRQLFNYLLFFFAIRYRW
jgi:Ca2+-binding EF-hand superfamily protein